MDIVLTKARKIINITRPKHKFLYDNSQRNIATVFAKTSNQCANTDISATIVSKIETTQKNTRPIFGNHDRLTIPSTCAFSKPKISLKNLLALFSLSLAKDFYLNLPP